MTVGPIDQLVVTDPLILSADMPIRRAAAQMAEADTAAAAGSCA